MRQLLNSCSDIFVWLVITRDSLNIYTIQYQMHLMEVIFQVSNVENLSPQTLKGVVKEMQDLVNQPPEGIKIQFNDEDVTDIQAYIEGPAGTPYVGGVFKVKLVLGKDFPQAPPKAFFLTKIFHPNVAANGEICVNTLKKDWKSDLGIKHILLVSFI